MINFRYLLHPGSPTHENWYEILPNSQFIINCGQEWFKSKIVKIQTIAMKFSQDISIEIFQVNPSRT